MPNIWQTISHFVGGLTLSCTGIRFEAGTSMWMCFEQHVEDNLILDAVAPQEGFACCGIRDSWVRVVGCCCAQVLVLVD